MQLSSQAVAGQPAPGQTTAFLQPQLLQHCLAQATGLFATGLLLANGTDTFAVAAGATGFTLPTPVAQGAGCTVTVQAQPAGEHCSLASSIGVIAGGNVTYVAVTCAAPHERCVVVHAAEGIADMVVWPWYGTLVKGQLYGAGEFLQVQEYTHVLRWTDRIAQRPAVRRGCMVNRTWGEPSSQLHERHGAGDFETKIQDKLGAAG